jgi:hypothetical protein
VELGEVEIHRQLERAGDGRTDVDDVHFSAHDEGIGFEHGCKNAA